MYRKTPELLSGIFKPGNEVTVLYDNAFYKCIVFWNKEKQRSYVSINGNQYDYFDCLR